MELKRDILRELLSGSDIGNKLISILDAGVLSVEELKRSGFVVDKFSSMLRNSFWLEYNRCYRCNESRIDISLVYSGICLREEFLNRVDSSIFCHYLLNPVLNYEKELECVIGEHGIGIYNSILNLDEYTDKEVLDVYKLKLQTLKLAEDRLYGKSTKKLEIRDDRVRERKQDMLDSLSFEEVKSKIDKLESELGNVSNEQLMLADSLKK